MKKFLLLPILWLLSFGVMFAQDAPPQAFSYMAAIKKSNGQPLSNKTISLKVSILQQSLTGTAVYIETFKPVTNNQGQIEVEIGRGEPQLGSFVAINWSGSSFFLKTEVDISGGESYQLLSVSQLLSVPYALFAGKAGSVLNESQQLSISGNTLSLSGGGGTVTLPATNVNGRFCYADKDGDGYGYRFGALWIPDNVSVPVNYVANDEDCNDENPVIYPSAMDGCDDVDNDCDGLTDEDCDECISMGIEILTCIENHCNNQEDMQAMAVCVMANCRYNFEECVDIFCVLSRYMDEEVKAYLSGLTKEEQAGYFLEHCGIDDRDGDGYSPANGDCNDLDATIYPGAVEICDDGIDQDCNGRDTYCNDADDDGYPIDVDCNDNDPTAFPGAPENCRDGYDKNCDGEFIPCVDNDKDGFFEDEDCDDSNPNINPDAEELCDGLDNDCDGQIDIQPRDGIPAYYDWDKDGIGGEDYIFVCNTLPEGFSSETGDCDDWNESVFPGAEEICDGLDNDCDGLVDNNPTNAWIAYIDNDEDGYGAGEPTSFCDGIPNGYADNNFDCDDADASINPAAEEMCDGLDNDCDGMIDEDIVAPPYNSGVGVCAGLTLICNGAGGWMEPDPRTIPEYEAIETLCDGLDNDCDGITDENCSNFDSDGDGYSEDQGDCDDNDATKHPGAIETWYDGIDSNCDGQNDFDQDMDGYVLIGFESQAGGSALGVGDCNDIDAWIHPGATEFCEDGIYQDCDGMDSYCNIDTDGDGILNYLEDVNHNGDYFDDDTDSDGIPNYLDEDDDNDGIRTIDEDANHDGDPTNDDTDGDGTPDYLDVS